MTTERTSTEGMHTPGPWQVVAADDGETYVCGGEPEAGNLPRPIAVMMRDDDEAHADANIIAAAPDMLAALRLAAEWLGEALIDELIDADEDYIANVRETHTMMLAVIYKAEGGAS